MLRLTHFINIVDEQLASREDFRQLLEDLITQIDIQLANEYFEMLVLLKKKTRKTITLIEVSQRYVH